jgi:hypothetical protein
VKPQVLSEEAQMHPLTEMPYLFGRGRGPAGTPRISRVSAVGGPSAVVTEGNQDGPIMCLTADTTHVYFTCGGTS